MSNLAYGTFTITNLSTVTSVDVYYYNSTSSTSLSGGSWSTDTPTWANNKYIWSKTVTTWEQGVTTQSEPVCITGQKGSTGATGQSVTKITQQYALSTSSTTAPSTGWSTTMPAFESGKFYWTRSEIVWANPTSTTYTTAVLANGITSANTNAETAKTDAASAVSTANTANQTANTANQTANTANQTAQNAVSVANGKSTIYYSNSKPTGGTYKAGDTWFFLTEDGYRIYEYDTTSSDWVQKSMDGKSITAGTVTAAQIQAGAITTNKLATNAIKSTNYQAGTAPYSNAGTFLDLSNGNIYSPNFGINNTNDNITDGAYIKGSIYAYNGTIGQSNTNYWYIGNYRGYDQQPSAYIKGNGTATIQLGSSNTWRLNTNRIHTAWNDDSNSGNAYRLHYPVFEDKYWDMGVHVPTSKTDKFLYIRSSDPNNAAISNSNTLENLSNDINDAIGDYWNYQFYVTSEGNLYAKNLYILDDNGGITQIAGTSAPYLLKSGGDISGNLTIGGTLKISNSVLNKSGNAITLQTSLTSTTAATLTGNSTSPISIGVTGTLPTSNGGTGNTSYNAGGVVYADNSSPKKLLSTAAGTSGYLLKSGGTGAPTWVDPGTLTVAAATKATQDGDGNVIKTTYLKLTGGNVTGPVSFGDSVSIDDLNAGTLIVTGNSSFTNNAQFNTINGVAVGSSPKFTDTTYAFDNGYSASNNKGATVLTVTNAIGALNVNPINGATNKTLTSISETAGKISATYSNISITKSQVSDFPTSMPASDVSAWAKANTKPSYKQDEILPLLSKTFTGVIGTENNWANATFFFGSIKPATWGEIWRIKYRIKVFVPGQPNYNQMADVMISGRAGDLKAYASLNTIGAYYVCYYHELYRMKEAGFNNGYGHSLGVRFYSAYVPTDTNYKRTIDVEILETENCTFSFYDSCLTYANIPGTGSTNYNTYTEMDFVNNGLQETRDNNDVNYYNRQNYTSRTTSAALYRYQICLTKSDGTLVPINSVNNSVATNKTLTIDSFDPFGEIFYWASTNTYAANANIGSSNLYRQYLADLRYSFNCGGYDTTPTLTARMPLYLVATPQADGTAKLYIEPLSMYLPSSEDRLIYIYLGRVYEDTKPYRVALSLNHPVYEYRNGAVRLYTGLKSETAASGGTNVSLVTTGQKYLWNSKTNNTGTVTSVAASGSGGITIGGSPITTSGTLAIGLNLSTAINGLGEGSSPANRNDYIVAQYAGGGTTTTTYHRRKLSNIFAALSADDIPNLAWSKITSGNDDLKAIEALTGTSGLLKKTAANTWTLDTTSYVPTSRTINGHALSGNISISKTDVGLGTVANALQIIDIGSNDAGQLVLTYGDNTTATRAVSITATTSSSVAKAEALNTGGKKVGDSNKPVYFGTDGKPVAISYTIEKSVPADAIFPKFEGTYNESTNKAATVSTVTNAINALDGNLNNTTPGAGKTLTAFSQTDGKISATFGNISITKSQISDFPTSLTPTAHTHGNISNTGTITSTAVALGNGDNLLFADSSNGGKIERSSITIGTGTSKYLRQDGTWGTPAGTYSLPVATDSVRGGVKIGYSSSGKNYAVQLSSQKMYVNVPWSDTTYSAGAGLSLSGTTFNHSNSVTAGTAGTSSATSSTNRTIAVPYITYDAQGHITGSGTHTHTIDTYPEAYLVWGGRNLAGNVTPVGMSISTEHSANRIAYLNPAAIAIEYTTNGGSTWADSGYTNDEKMWLCTGNQSIVIGQSKSGYSQSTALTTNHWTRITLTGQNGSTGYVYTDPKKLLINISSALRLNCLIEYKTGVSEASWQTFGTYTVSGWSGWNDIPLILGTFGGDSTKTNNNWYLRFTFKVTSTRSDSYKGYATVLGLRLFGTNNWTSASLKNNKGPISSTGHLYSYDTAANATFPAQVTATQFNGELNGNANTATTATTAETLTNKVLDSLTLNSTAGSFTFQGDGVPWDGTDWVGLQVGSNNDKFQIHALNGTTLEYRQNDSGGTNSNWGDWYSLLSAGNYTDYTVKKDGTGATGSWGISITGNAATATKATQDGSGNVITNTYLKKAGDSTTGGLAINASNSYGSYNEGLRINAGARTYATLLLGGTNNSTSGTNDGAFWLGVYNTSSYTRRLMIAHNGSTATNTYFYSSSASQVSPALHLGASGTITSGNADAITGGTVYTALTQGYVTLTTEQTISGRKTFENLAAVTFKPSSGTDNCSINYDSTLGALVFSF